MKAKELADILLKNPEIDVYFRENRYGEFYLNELDSSNVQISNLSKYPLCSWDVDYPSSITGPDDREWKKGIVIS